MQRQPSRDIRVLLLTWRLRLYLPQRLYDCKTVADTPLDSPEYGTPFLRKVQGRAAAGVGILLKELQNSLYVAQPVWVGKFID